jgi:hypothetical protein
VALEEKKKLVNGSKWAPSGIYNLWSFSWFEKQIIKSEILNDKKH